MPILQDDDFVLNYEIDGPDNAPVVILSNSLGTEMGLWAPQVAVLSQHFRVVRYDSRGHGETDVTPGPYSIAQLGADVLMLMDHLDIGKAHFCGISMGGMVGMWLAAHHPDRIARLVLANTAALIGTPQMWNTRIENINSAGMPSMVPAILGRWFTESFTASAPATVVSARTMLLRTTTTGYTACCAALRDADLRENLAAIGAPTLVIAGSHDQATTPADGQLLADGIRAAQFLELDAAHLSNLEQAEQFNVALLAFLQ